MEGEENPNSQPMEEKGMTEELIYEVRRDWWLWFFHPDYVEHRKLPGWSGFLPFYRFTCNKHGKQVSYLHGHRQRLICKECVKEN